MSRSHTCRASVTAIVAVAFAAVAFTSVAAAVEAATDPANARSAHRQLLADLTARQALGAPYVVIDTRANHVVVRDADHRIERRAVCATGAARRFEGTKRRHKWVFATPSGRFSVLRKVEDPLWTRPEWDFLEVDEEIPVFAEDPRRFQRGILGRYALYFAKGYMIHGTLYEINLGKSITHGCVRVGGDDLSYLYDRVQAGWPVYIF